MLTHFLAERWRRGQIGLPYLPLKYDQQSKNHASINTRGRTWTRSRRGTKRRKWRGKTVEREKNKKELKKGEKEEDKKKKKEEEKEKLKRKINILFLWTKHSTCHYCCGHFFLISEEDKMTKGHKFALGHEFCFKIKKQIWTLSDF